MKFSIKVKSLKESIKVSQLKEYASNPLQICKELEKNKLITLRKKYLNQG